MGTYHTLAAPVKSFLRLSTCALALEPRPGKAKPRLQLTLSRLAKKAYCTRLSSHQQAVHVAAVIEPEYLYGIIVDNVNQI